MTALDLLTLANKTSLTGAIKGQNVSIITKACRYYHYCCDGFDDRVSNIFIASFHGYYCTCYMIYVGINESLISLTLFTLAINPCVSYVDYA